MADSLLGIDDRHILLFGGDEMNPIIVRRQKKHEAEMAVNDLLAKGFILTYGITEHTRDGKSFSRDSYGRRIFQHNTFSSCWIAKLVRAEA